MSLQTPDKIRTLQRKLYLKAKAEPDFRFYLLYDKIYREDILRHAYDLMHANNGAPGVDGVTFEQVEAEGLAVQRSPTTSSPSVRRHRKMGVHRHGLSGCAENRHRPWNASAGDNSRVLY